MTRDDIVERGMNAPLYAGVLADATHRGARRNEGCQDFVHFDFKINEVGLITEARHKCKACVLTTAMADILCEAMEMRKPIVVSTLDPFRLIGIPIGPNRRECILVAWEALHDALKISPNT